MLFKVSKLLGLLSMNEAAVQFLFFVLFCFVYIVKKRLSFQWPHNSSMTTTVVH